MAGSPAPPTGSMPAEIDLAALLERRARSSGERGAVTFDGETRCRAFHVPQKVRYVPKSGGAPTAYRSRPGRSS